ncbi:MAG: peptidoglycan DD-metalloendopeptidase family protein, partial [Hylemonella sp.]
MARNYTNIVPNATSVTSGFSPARPHPTLGETRPHNGVDVAAPAGSPIYAPSDGIVDKVGINPNSSAGYWLSIKHTLPDGTVVFTRYLHLQEKPSLNEKEPISEGQEIGKVGNTGKTPEGRPIGTGPHLHYEERMLPPDSKSKTPSWSDATPLNPEWDRFRFSGGIPYDYYRRPEFNREFRKPFSDAKGWQPPRDPIILDLDGDGLETVGLASNVYFDHDGDGVLTKTVWAGKDDALLVWDRNGNALIDTGAELFGDFTPLPNGTLAPNGFAALAALDANGDGVIDASDPAFAELKLWRDTSQDGQTGAGELISLADAGIVSLNLAHTLKNQRLSNGNTLSREGSFTRADGST